MYIALYTVLACNLSGINIACLGIAVCVIAIRMEDAAAHRNLREHLHGALSHALCIGQAHLQGLLLAPTDLG